MAKGAEGFKDGMFSFPDAGLPGVAHIDSHPLLDVSWLQMLDDVDESYGRLVRPSWRAAEGP